MKALVMGAALALSVAALVTAPTQAGASSACGDSVMDDMDDGRDADDGALDRDDGLDRGGYRAGDAPDNSDVLNPDRDDPARDDARPDIGDDEPNIGRDSDTDAPGTID